MYFPRGKKLKYLKYIRLRLQDHHRSFEHASVYRIITVYKMFILSWTVKKKKVGDNILCTTLSIHFSHSMSLVCLCTRNVYLSLIKSFHKFTKMMKVQKYVKGIFFFLSNNILNMAEQSKIIKLIGLLVSYTDC